MLSHSYAYTAARWYSTAAWSILALLYPYGIEYLE